MNEDGIPCKLRQIYFYLTEGCNLRCCHCWINPKYQSGDNLYGFLNLSLFKDIICQAKSMGLEGVKLTGGEPLLHPDIWEMLVFLRKEEIRLTIETNGILCTKELAQEIARSNNSFVAVSLDGAEASVYEEIRGVKDSFDRAVEGIKNLAAAGLKPQVIFTLMRKNLDQMEEVIRLSESLGAGSVKINILMPTLRGKNLHDMGEALSLDEYVEIGHRVEHDLYRATSLNLFYSHPPAFKPLSRMFDGDDRGRGGVCGILGIIGVLYDGSYALCGIGKNVPDLIFGNAEKDQLEEVWRTSPILNELREGLPHRLEGVCGICMMKGWCYGSCIAQNYYRDKNLWSSFWYCEEAKKKNLFPKTRIL